MLKIIVGSNSNKKKRDFEDWQPRGGMSQLSSGWGRITSAKNIDQYHLSGASSRSASSMGFCYQLLLVWLSIIAMLSMGSSINSKVVKVVQAVKMIM